MQSKAFRMICAWRTLFVSLFPQRVILTRFGAAPSVAPLVATLTRYSLINGVVCNTVHGHYRGHGQLIQGLIGQTLQMVTVALRAAYRCEPNSRHRLVRHHA